MQEDAINVFCLSHGVSFPTLRSNRVIICKENHVLSYNFPHSGKWFYCCLCQQYWGAPKGQGGQGSFSKQCPSCNLIKKARYYSCDQCNVTMIDSLGAINRKEIHITPWGTPHPHCPGCQQLPKSVPQSHACPELNGLLTTARAECPFCEVGEGAEGAVDIEGSGNETEIVRIESAGEVFDPSYLVLEELERKTSEMRSLEAEAEAREAKARERLRQVETRLRQEMLRRSEVERKSREIEEDLRRQSEIDRDRIDAAIKTADSAARFEEERNARIAAEQAKAEAEAKLREMEARASGAEERLRQAETRLQIEENYKVEINWIRAELEEALTTTRQAEENHRDEMARITAEAEENHRDEMARITAEAEENHRDEMARITAEAEENHRDEMARITAEAEAKYREMENRARQAETCSRRLYLILKLGFSSAEQIIAEALNVGDEDEKDAMIIPLDLAANAYPDNSSPETPGSGANGSVDYEDFPFSDRMRALFEAAARANATNEEGV